MLFLRKVLLCAQSSVSLLFDQIIFFPNNFFCFYVSIILFTFCSFQDWDLFVLAVLNNYEKLYSKSCHFLRMYCTCMYIQPLHYFVHVYSIEFTDSYWYASLLVCEFRSAHVWHLTSLVFFPLYIPEFSLDSDSDSEVSKDSEVLSGKFGSWEMSINVSLYSGLLGTNTENLLATFTQAQNMHTSIHYSVTVIFSEILK